MTSSSYYRRPLPPDHVPFSSPEGRELFREALDAGTMNAFFALSEQFHTQAEPAYCGLGSLVVALNALGIDPGRLWKGPWRWFDESLLDCCVDLDTIQKRGLTLVELGCLARCNGARASVVRALEVEVDSFRRDVLEASRASQGSVVIAGYDRRALGQTGDGHFSPLGGYHAHRDLALVLDVARFKYPPHWVDLGRLFDACRTTDPATGQSRGWVRLEAEVGPRPIFLRLGLPVRGWRATVDEVTRRAADLGGSTSAWVRAILGFAPMLGEVVEPIAAAMGSETAPEHRAAVDQVLADARSTEAYGVARAELAGAAESRAVVPEVVAILAIVFGDRAGRAAVGAALQIEVDALRGQLEAVCAMPRGAATAAPP